MTMKFGYFNTLINSMCPNLVKAKEKYKVKLYDDISSYVNQKLDISYYLKTMENFERLKLLMLSTEQNVSFDFIKNPDLNNEEELNCFELQMNKDRVSDAIVLINYYTKKARDGILDKIDIEMLPLIDPEIRKFMIEDKL